MDFSVRMLMELNEVKTFSLHNLQLQMLEVTRKPSTTKWSVWPL